MRAKGHRVLSILLGSLLKFSAKVFQSQSLLNSWEMCVHVRSCRFVTFSFISDYQRGPIGMVTAAGVSAMITCSIQALHVPWSWIGISFSSWLERQGGCVVRGSHFTLDVGIGKDQQQGIAHFLSEQSKNVPAGAVTHAPGVTLQAPFDKPLQGCSAFDLQRGALEGVISWLVALIHGRRAVRLLLCLGALLGPGLTPYLLITHSLA